MIEILGHLAKGSAFLVESTFLGLMTGVITETALQNMDPQEGIYPLIQIIYGLTHLDTSDPQTIMNMFFTGIPIALLVNAILFRK